MSFFLNWNIVDPQCCVSCRCTAKWICYMYTYTHSFFFFFSDSFFQIGHYRVLSRASCSMGFPGGSDGKESACSAGDWGSIPGSGRSPGGGNGNPLQCSCLENPVGGGAWQATVYEVTVRHDWATSLSFFHFPVLHHRFLLVIYLIYGSVYV